MGAYKYIRDLWKKPKKNLKDLWKERIVEWRKEPSTVRVNKPTRVDKARSLGYKAKGGVLVVRQRVSRKKRMRPQKTGGRRSKTFRQKKITDVNYRAIAERRVNEKYINCEVMNSYYVGEDAGNVWYEVILVDKNHPQVVKDSELKGIASQSSRSHRGLTSAGRKHRGLRNKGKGSEKIRPSEKGAYRRKL